MISVQDLTPFDSNIAYGDAKKIEFWTGQRVRETFVRYFCEAKEHTMIPSSSTIPHEDATLLFANSGMAQFKSIFQGTIDPNAPFAKLRRAANTQKCIRAGGKHNDLEDVGKDTYHHTFFEMLGNWSFGDYFKKEAIEMAWELLTVVYGLPADRLYVTYFAGNSGLGLPPDEEARDLWLAVGISPDRVLPYGMKENFWEMGESGPCGPCSEIHFDRIGGRDASLMVNADDPDVLEIWNLVFMQYNRELDGSLLPLPARHVDTGMGFERVVSVLQDKRSNYDTDIFGSIFAAIKSHCPHLPDYGVVSCGTPSFKHTTNPDIDPKINILVQTDVQVHPLTDMAYRVVADHIRTLTIALSDGGVPSNDGRGYVLRRILRRAVRYAHEVLAAPPLMLVHLVDVVVASLGESFSEIKRSIETVKSLIKEEEEQFRRTLERGLVQFNKYASNLKKGDLLSGADAWRLYDTYGFPTDLTRLMAEERGLRLCEEDLLKAQAAAKEASRGESNSEGADKINLDVHQLSLLENSKVPRTDDSFKYFELSLPMVSILATVDNSGNLMIGSPKNVEPGRLGLILDRTPFYAESGGQIADKGSIIFENSCFVVENVQVFAGYILHIGTFDSNADITTGVAKVDESRRESLCRNHTATHLLNWKLAVINSSSLDLNNAAISTTQSRPEQKGSLVASDRLRFDFSASVSTDVGKIEEAVRKEIEKRLPVSSAVLPLADALRLPGVRAVFGETYPDPVRVVMVGPYSEKSFSDMISPEYQGSGEESSIELCGGTHVSNIESIGSFVILSEGAIAKGIRRIVAATGPEAVHALKEEDVLSISVGSFEKSVGLFSSSKGDDTWSKNTLKILYEIEQLNTEVKELSRRLEDSVIGCVTKSLLRDRVKIARASLQTLERDARNSQASIVRDLALHGEDLVVVRRIDVATDNSKAIIEALNALTKIGRSGLLYTVLSTSTERSSLTSNMESLELGTTDASVLKVSYFASVSETHKANLDANVWLRKFADILGGRCGGKNTSAQGGANISDASLLINAHEAAITHVRDLLNQ